MFACGGPTSYSWESLNLETLKEDSTSQINVLFWKKRLFAKDKFVGSCKFDINGACETEVDIANSKGTCFFQFLKTEVWIKVLASVVKLN